MRVESADYLKKVYKTVWQAWGAPEHQAEVFAKCILAGDLVGQIAQGIVITQIDHLMVSSGQLNITAEPTIEKEGISYVVINGNRGTGQYIATRAMEMAIEKAKASTIGIAWFHDWHDIGCASAYSRIALGHDMVGIFTVNSVPLSAPYGGRDMLMSAGPFNLVCPAGEEKPIIFDTGLCGIFDYHWVLALEAGKRLAQKWIVDPETGELTDDPAPYIKGINHRTMRIRAANVFPDPKMYGFNIFGEVLTGLLTPGGFTSDQTHYPAWDSIEKGIQLNRGGGGFCMAINVSELMPIDEFKAKIDRWIRTIKSSRLQKGFKEILLPGERALREEERRLKEGVPIRDDHWAALVKMAEEVGVDVEAIR